MSCIQIFLLKSSFLLFTYHAHHSATLVALPLFHSAADLKWAQQDMPGTREMLMGEGRIFVCTITLKPRLQAVAELYAEGFFHSAKHDSYVA